jgi:hypothetical protein
MRRVAVWVAALYWGCCLAFHAVVTVTQPGPLPEPFGTYCFFLTLGLATAVVFITKPAGRGENSPAPRWYVSALAVAALVFGGWPIVVGSGVPNTHKLSFGDTGVAAGERGDRYLHDHGRRVRDPTEAEFQRVQVWKAIEETGMMAGFAGMVLAGALYFQQVRRAPSPAPPPAPAATQASGTS